MAPCAGSSGCHSGCGSCAGGIGGIGTWLCCSYDRGGDETDVEVEKEEWSSWRCDGGGDAPAGGDIGW